MPSSRNTTRCSLPLACVICSLIFALSLITFEGAHCTRLPISANSILLIRFSKIIYSYLVSFDMAIRSTHFRWRYASAQHKYKGLSNIKSVPVMQKHAIGSLEIQQSYTTHQKFAFTCKYSRETRNAWQHKICPIKHASRRAEHSWSMYFFAFHLQITFITNILTM